MTPIEHFIYGKPFEDSQSGYRVEMERLRDLYFDTPVLVWNDYRLLAVSWQSDAYLELEVYCAPGFDGTQFTAMMAALYQHGCIHAPYEYNQYLNGLIAKGAHPLQFNIDSMAWIVLEKVLPIRLTKDKAPVYNRTPTYEDLLILL